MGEARVDVVEGDGEVGEVGQPFEHGVEAAVFDVGEVAQLDRRECVFEVLEQRPDARVVEARGVQDREAVHAGREVVRLAEQVEEEFAVDAAGEGEVLQLGRPAHVDAERAAFVTVRAAREVDGFDRPEAA